MNLIKHIIQKEFLQLRRDPKMMVIILFAPIMQLIFFGYAVNMDVEHVSTVVFDQDKSTESRNYLDKFTSSGYFDFIDYVNNYDQLQKYIENGEATLGIIIPKDFEKKLLRKETVRLQAIFDGSDGNKASIAAGYLAGITQTYTKKIFLDFSNRTGKKVALAGSLSPQTRAWYNPELKTRNFMVPGIVGMLLSIITLILTSLAIVKEKEIETLEQLIVTPIKPMQLILGKITPFAILSFVVIALVLSVMYLVFDIPVKGSVIFLFFSSFIYILSTLGFGILVSIISKTQQQAMMLAIFVVMMPMVFLSGFAFPIENMPAIIQALTYAVPLRYFMTIIRGVILKGIGVNELWIELSVLFMIGMAVFSLSAFAFRKKLG